MKLNFRAIDDRPPPIPGPGNFSDQRLRGGYGISPNVVPPNEYRGGYPNVEPPNQYRGGYSVQPPNDYRGGYGINPNVDSRESVQREIEKARIREEIIAMEMERRRLMEAEARRLMVAPEFEDRLFNQRSEFTPHPFDGRFVQDHPSAYHVHGSFNMLPAPPLQQRWPEPPPAHQPQLVASKDKIIFLPKPQPRTDLSGIKRKAVTPPTVLTESKKKPKEEWSCALCQVSASDQKGLNRHLEGKKHKGREAGLQAEKAAKLSSRKQLPKKTIVPKPARDIELESGVRSAAHSFPVETNDNDFVQKSRDPNKNKAEDLPWQERQNADHMDHQSAFPGRGSFSMLSALPQQQQWPEPTAYQHQTNASNGKILFLPQTDLSGRKQKAVTQPLVPMESKKKPNEWYCAMCQVCATSKKALDHHLGGKKHKGREARLEAEKAAKLKPGAKSDDKDFVQKIKDTEENKAEELSSRKRQSADHMKEKEKDGEAIANEWKKMNLKSWCEICKIGPLSERVIKTHKNGKKHMARLKELGLNEAVAAQEEKDVMVPPKQADNVTPETIIPDRPSTV